MLSLKTLFAISDDDVRLVNRYTASLTPIIRLNLDQFVPFGLHVYLLRQRIGCLSYPVASNLSKLQRCLYRMPMLLTVTFDDESQSSAAASLQQRSTHCSISLPTDIAASLNELTPFAPLTIFRLQLPTKRDIFVAWHGNTVQKSHTLGLHRRFASTLALQAGYDVKLTIVERVHSSPQYSLLSTTLRPLSYRSPEDSANENSGDDNAIAQFQALSSTADSLQQTFLSQIRVVFPSLTFPLALPAGEIIPVNVVSITAHGVTDPPYAVLLPDSQIEIESPPLPSASHSKQRSSVPVRWFCRVVPLPWSLLSDIPDAVLRTHAFLPPPLEQLLDEANQNNTSIIMVSRKHGDKQPALAVPVSFLYHPAISSRYVALPPSLWHRLQLTPLTPLLVERISSPTTYLSTISTVPVTRGEDAADLPTLDDVISTSSVYYHEMALQSSSILTEKQTTNLQTLPGEHHVEPWFDPNLEKPTEADMQFVDWDDDDLLSLLRVEKTRPTRTSNRIVLKPYSTSPQQKVKVVYSDMQWQYASTDTDGYPCKEETFRRSLLSSVTPNIQAAVHSLVLAARGSLQDHVARDSQGNGEKSNSGVLVLEGGAGSGRTFACKTVAALLRDVANVRTIWLSGHVHADDSMDIRMRRLDEAFSAAVDEGAGMVVVDDVDKYIGHVTDIMEGEEANEVSDEKKMERSVLCQRLEQLVWRRSKYACLWLLSCDRVHELPTNVRAPLFISQLVSVKMATAVDRGFLFFRALSSVKEEDSTEVRSGDGPEDECADVSELSLSLGKLTEGYCLRDVDVCIGRAMFEQNQQSVNTSSIMDSSVRRVFQAIQSTIETMTPMNRIGIKVKDEKEGEKLSWSKIGGIPDVISEMQEALELPCSHPEIFRNVPIRLPHGLLIYGPPGCGKTLVAKTAASESGMQCIVVKGPELMGKYIGQSEAEVRRAFERAAACAPCVLMFDEFDSLAACRGGWDGGVTDRVVNTLLTCMDGAERLSDGVYIVATSSRPEVIDPALLRPGRLDRWIAVNVPEEAGARFDIIERLAHNLLHVTSAVTEGLRKVADDTDGYTGADLGAIVNDAHVLLGEMEGPQSDELRDQLVVKCLLDARRNSRPSLSGSQRAQYELRMAHFSGRAREPKGNEEYGKKLAFK